MCFPLHVLSTSSPNFCKLEIEESEAITAHNLQTNPDMKRIDVDEYIFQKICSNNFLVNSYSQERVEGISEK